MADSLSRTGPHSRSGLALERIDRSISPGADFFRFANGRWYDAAVLNADETYAGARADLISMRKIRIRAIIEDAGAGKITGPVAALVGPMYVSFLDERSVEAAGLAPARSDLDRIRAMATTQDLLDLFAEAVASGFPSAISASIFYDFHEPGRLRYQLTPGGLGLPRRELYTEAAAAAADLRAAYKRYVAEMLRLAGEEDSEAKAERVFELETRLAAAAWPSAEARDFLKTANPRSIEQLEALVPRVDWKRYVERAGVAGVDTVIITQPSAMAPLFSVIFETPMATWRLWALTQYLTLNAPYLPKRFADARFDFFERRIAGQREPQPRWQRAVELVEAYFADDLGQLYVERHFPERNKRIVLSMFDNVRAVMRSKIEQASWMEAATRSEALRKIDELNVKIGYPDEWPAYESLKLNPADLFSNVKAARARAWRARASLVYASLPRGRWMTAAQTSGAAANPNLNEITIPAGALEPPYFSPTADPAVNYGAIGAIIAHELSHLFDQLGRQMDATGKLRDWWAPEDGARYQTVADKVVAQYDGLVLREDMRVNGRVTQNENIADIAGLDIAFAAWKRSLGGCRAPVLDGFTGEQRFFLAWAQMRSGKMSDAMQRQQLTNGPHAPDEIRGTQPLRNIDEWYKAFGVRPGDPLFLAQPKRAKFW